MLTLIVVLLGLCAGVLFYVARKPDNFRIERTQSIAAPSEKIFPYINDFRQWTNWSPWEGIDPHLKRTFSGAESGVGSVYEWNGDKNVGQGRMEIVESDYPTKVVMKLHFIKPFEAHNHVAFSLRQDGDSTQVTQAMYGPSPFISKLMGLFFNMDKMVGDKYEQGLRALQHLVEHTAKP